ncbi:TonB-dependent receptor [Novosphingobium rosa]|uniref:TonB-dependent receptor n=1 Tax=Novosphingobium rosa TaxID=76978 RepID=UPI000A7E728D|nr:TonB-dependent receptor [Novosphingobium rosa]
MTNRLIATLLTGIAISALAHPACAQTAPDTAPAAGEPAPGEIVVTAQKRAERLQDVPVSVTALSAQSLATRNITDTTNIGQISPSLTYTQGTNPTNSNFRIRGIGTAVFGVGNESSVSVVMDGVVMARAAQGFTDLADIERVEVLRGPQGTLFGKNATGGAINIVTARPTDTFTGKMSATVAEMGEYHVNGTVSGPLAEHVKARLTAFYNKDDGFTYNTTLQHKTNGSESWGVRGKVEFDFDRLNVLASASYGRTHTLCCQSVFIRADNANLVKLLSPVVAGPNNNQVSSNLDTVTSTKQQVYSIEAKYDAGAISVTSITAYQKFNLFNNQDVDNINTGVPIYTGGTAAPYYASFDVNGGAWQLDNFTQELRASNAHQGRLNYVAGVFYSDVTIDRGFTRRIVTCNAPASAGLAIGAACPAANTVGSSGQSLAHLRSDQYAFFGQVDYNLVGGLKAIGGARWQHEFISVYGFQYATPPFAGDSQNVAVTNGYTAAADNVLTGKLGLQYEFSRRAQAYATYTRGYKGQSLGTEYNQTFNNNALVRPETVNAYEVGFKGSTADHRLSIAISAYLAKYKDLQVQANRSDQSTGNFLFVVTNAGHAETKGIEIEGTVRPTDRLSIGTSFAYTHARFDADGLACPLQYQAAFTTVAYGAAAPTNACFKQVGANGVVSGANQNVRNGVLPNTPAWRFTLNPHYDLPLGRYTAYADANLNYQSSVLFALEQDPLLVQKAYATVDLSLGLRPAGKGLSFAIFIKNLTDQRFYSAMGHASELTSQTVTPNNLTAFVPKAAMRYVGATIGYSF